MRPATPAADTPAPGRARLLPWLLFALAVLTVLAMSLVRWLLQPERLGALLVERAARTTGLEVVVAQPARLGVWPGLQLELIGLQARLPGRPVLLAAERVDIALPLALLWGGELEIGALALRSPRLDLVEWRHWRDRDLAVGPPAPPALPDLAAAVTISDGMLLGEGWQLARIDLDASPLRNGLPFAATGAATLLLPDVAHAARFTIDATPVEAAQGIELQQFALRLGSGATAEALTLDGEAFVGTGRLELQVTALLDEDWPPAWPALPAWAHAHAAGRRMQLDYAGTLDLDGRMQLRDERPSSFTVEGNPRQLLDWRNAGTASPLPPVAASMQLERVELDGAVIEGLKVGLEALPAASDD